MSNDLDTVSAVEFTANNSLHRRGVMRGMAAAVMATTAGGFALPAFAADADIGGRQVIAYKGKYAISGDTIVDGYFASPRGKTKLDVVVVIPTGTSLDRAAVNAARGHALAGKIAIVPDLRATSSGMASVGGRDAMIAEFMKSVPELKLLAHGNGKVTVVTLG